MEENDDKTVKRNGIIAINFINENLTVIDLSHKNLSEIDDDRILLPAQLRQINLSHNNFTLVPKCVMRLKNLENVDISFNNIEYFDDTPNFCHSIEEFNISNNKLLGPPYWIWSQAPKKLMKVDLSNNPNVTKSFVVDCNYYEELLRYTTPVKEVIMYNCNLRNYKELISNFVNATHIKLGNSNLSLVSHNTLVEVPFKGLEKCLSIECLNLRYTAIDTITPNIEIYENLKEIDLANNKLSGLPKEFCKLKSLEVCLLSNNYILYLPNEIVNLEKLKVLSLDSNILCMIPDTLSNMQSLKKLDLYDNNMYDIPNIESLEEVDLAQNYFEEPDDNSYTQKRNKLRLHTEERYCGKKAENIKPESEHSPDTTDDELDWLKDGIQGNEQTTQERPPSSSSEDWDSDDWWVPHDIPRVATPPRAQWMLFVQEKIRNGNFCPIDMHAVSIYEKVRYEEMCNPRVINEVPGQFDDYSEDDS